eukprot:jgi/Mesvir1/6206/Mv00888-RA.1
MSMSLPAESKGDFASHNKTEADSAMLKDATKTSLPSWVVPAAIITAVAVGAYFLLQRQSLPRGPSVPILAAVPTGMNLTLFGKTFLITDRTPGWYFFMMLMSAGLGVCVSEEALCTWVGGALGRVLANGTPMDTFPLLMAAVAREWQHVVATTLWVYWGVTISDLAPFYMGRLAAAKSSGYETLRTKVLKDPSKLDALVDYVRKHGDMIGFVERFSVGIRNPIGFIAGFTGVPPVKYFAGVCLGAMCTLPLQMTFGFLLRNQPVAALTGVTTAIAMWTFVPYIAAGVAGIVVAIKSMLRPVVSGSGKAS